ncbi:MAG: HIT family protein [Candidatus Bruticola sp.]
MGELDRMWAPWRMEMIKAPKYCVAECFLCVKHAQDNDKENLVLERGKTCYCLMNLYPYNNCHLMIVPYRHGGNIMELSPEEMQEIMTMAQTWIEVIKRSAHAEGFNVGMNIGRVSGAGMAEHLHLHIVPRWNGDTNFMSVFGGSRVINQALEETWKELKKCRLEMKEEKEAQADAEKG